MATPEELKKIKRRQLTELLGFLLAFAIFVWGIKDSELRKTLGTAVLIFMFGIGFITEQLDRLPERIAAELAEKQ